MTRRAGTVVAFLPLLVACGGGPSQPVTPINTPSADAGPAASAEPKPTSNQDAELIRKAIKDGEAALKGGNVEEAKRIFSSLLDRHPDNARANHYMGVCLESVGQKDEAEKHYRAALEKAPDLADAAVNLSASLIDGSKVDEAIKVLRAALTKVPSDPMLHANLGHALLASKDRAGAIREYRAALALANDPQTRLSLAAQLAADNKKDEAVAELKKVAASAADNRALLATAADSLGRLGAYSDCVSAFDKAIAIQAAAELYVQRGICRHELKDEAGAKDDYDKAVKLDPNYAPAQYYLGEYFRTAGKKADAIKAFEKCKQLKPESPWAKKATERINEMKAPKK